MAINTEGKRRSTIAALPVPDGTIGTQDRPHVCWIYAGLVISGVVTLGTFTAIVYAQISPTGTVRANLTPAATVDVQLSPAASLRAQISPTGEVDAQPSPAATVEVG